ncbi:MAG: 4-(cytidine 5'-diphospho)-2-C-methyl-D-erythritol kinase [Candidatus Melainabacteria bacterium RIFOXYA12_FULL_32_12]|nr:MAG: 4-(cytidine 5'-diphospho)-2-C-methyl-D-erythritol kinase [Candidatus Melainabacteria bacterium RIFOXYA2_FULL_32_9]OGI30177.1 MAG: 4-(cytidine 5'-diphospho)-2-C-methyl-D-erythritol kinase [Candidatus Melainabacteria bacterium RIFOXYA12_FULL_32_12]
MKTIKIKTPAKINLTLEILEKRKDGYHNIQSIMQTVSLYDFLTITVDENDDHDNIIDISGNNPLIPYDESNLAYISAEKYLKKSGIISKKVSIFIEKHIPIAAGLAGGSSNAAGVLYGLNEIFGKILDNELLSVLASQIGADVNFCLYGGTQLATLKGEKLKKLPTPDLNIIIVKPKDLFISAKEAYDKYSKLSNKPENKNTEAMIEAIKENNTQKIASLLNNTLEAAILNDYPVIKDIKAHLIKKGCLNAVMSGSGPSVFAICDKSIDLSELKKVYDEVYEVSIVSHGACNIALRTNINAGTFLSSKTFTDSTYANSPKCRNNEK